METRPQTEQRRSAERRWTRVRQAAPWLDVDLGVGILVGSLVGWIASQNLAVREAGPASLYAILGVAAGVLGIVLGVLSIFVALLSDDYMTVLAQTPGGVRRAWSPFLIIAGVSVAASLVAVVAVIAWPVIPAWAQVLTLGSATGLLAWSLVGTAQLVRLAAFHGAMRIELFTHVRDARKLLRERRGSDRSA